MHCMLQAARDGKKDIVKIWLHWYENNPITDKRGHKTQNPVDVKDAEGLAALHYAARFNKLKILSHLLQYEWKPGLSFIGSCSRVTETLQYIIIYYHVIGYYDNSD